MRASFGVLDEAISEFCEPDEEYLPPTARTLLIASVLRVVKIDLSENPEIHHEIGYFDMGDLIGGHDVYIYLDVDLRPTGAYMDG